MAAIRAVFQAAGLSIGFTGADIIAHSLLSGVGHGSPHGAGGTRHNPPGGEVAEQHNALLPPQNGK